MTKVLSEEMKRVLHHIANKRPGACGSIVTRRALVRHGLLNEISDEGYTRYEVSAAGAATLEAQP